MVVLPVITPSVGRSIYIRGRKRSGSPVWGEVFGGSALYLYQLEGDVEWSDVRHSLRRGGEWDYLSFPFLVAPRCPVTVVVRQAKRVMQSV